MRPNATSDEGQPPAVNKKAALALVGDDEELFMEIAQIFLEDSRNYKEKLHNALEEKNVGQVEHFAHTLKGAAANICATPFKETAGEIELAARNEDLDRAGQVYGKFEQEFQRLMAYLAEIGVK